jgi:hypothetical protein
MVTENQSIEDEMAIIWDIAKVASVAVVFFSVFGFRA